MKEIFNRYFAGIFFSVLFILIILREPAIFYYPRFWAEEGMIFYSFAYHHSFLENLLTPLVGYYTFFNVIISTIQAFFISVEHAPLVTTSGGLIVQILPFLLIFASTSIYFDSNLKKLIFSIAILLITPTEIWVNTTNSHFHFGLITFLILISENSGVIIRRLKYMLLIMGSLTGPMSAFFAPLILLKYIKNRDSESRNQMVASLIAGSLQVGVTIYCLLYNNNYNRFVERNVVVSLKAYIGDNFGLLMPFGTNDRFVVGLFIMPISIFMFWHIFQRRQIMDYLTIASFFIISILSLFGSLNMAGGPRYGFVPTVILICLFGRWMQEFDIWTKYAFMRKSLIACFLLIHLVGFKLTSKKIYKPTYPNWSSEVVKWRDDSNYKMKIHPFDENKNWNVSLSPKK